MGFFGPGGLSSGDSGQSLNPDLVKALQAQFPSLAPQDQGAPTLQSMGYSFPGVQLYQGQGTGNFASLSPFESAGGASPESITGGLAMGTFGKSSSQTPAGQPTQGLGSLSLPSLNLPMAQVASSQAASGGASGDTGLGAPSTPVGSNGIGLDQIMGGAGQAVNYLTQQGRTTGPQQQGQPQSQPTGVDYSNATGSPGGLPQWSGITGGMSPSAAQAPLSSPLPDINMQQAEFLNMGNQHMPTPQLSVSQGGDLLTPPGPVSQAPLQSNMPTGDVTSFAPGGANASQVLGQVPGSTNWLGVGQGAVGALGGLLNTVGGIQGGNAVGAGLGGLQTIGGIAQALQSSPQLVNMIASQIGTTGQGLSGALGGVGGAVGGIGGLYSLYQGIQTGDPIQIATGLVSAYAGGSALAGEILGTALPSITGALTTGIAAVAPEAAMAIATAIGGQAAVAASEAALAAGATATEATSAALSTVVGGVAGAAAPVIMAIVSYFQAADEMRIRHAGFTNNPIAGNLYSNATAGVQGAQGVFDQLAQNGDLSGADTADLADALSKMSQGLLPYYQTAEGGAGPLRASSTVTGGGLFENKGQGPDAISRYTGNFTNAQQGMVSIVNELLKRGVPYEEIGALPVTGDYSQASLDMGNPFTNLYGANAGKWDTEANALIQKMIQGELANGNFRVTQPEMGPPTYSVASGATSGGIPTGDFNTVDLSTLNPQQLLTAMLGASGAAPDSETRASGLMTQMFGGPMWAALARMNTGGPDIQNAISQHFDPWTYARQMSPDQLAAAFHLGAIDTSGSTPLQSAQSTQSAQGQWDPYWSNVINQRSQQISAQDPMQQALQQYMTQLSGLQGNLGQIGQAAQQLPTGGLDPNLVAAMQANPAGFAGGNGAFSPMAQGGGVDLQALLRQLGYIAA